jgi:hypothetical protein
MLDLLVAGYPKVSRDYRRAPPMIKPVFRRIYKPAVSRRLRIQRDDKTLA